MKIQLDSFNPIVRCPLLENFTTHMMRDYLQKRPDVDFFALTDIVHCTFHWLKRFSISTASRMETTERKINVDTCVWSYIWYFSLPQLQHLSSTNWCTNTYRTKSGVSKFSFVSRISSLQLHSTLIWAFDKEHIKKSQQQQQQTDNRQIVIML